MACLLEARSEDRFGALLGPTRGSADAPGLRRELTVDELGPERSTVIGAPCRYGEARMTALPDGSFEYSGAGEVNRVEIVFGGTVRLIGGTWMLGPVSASRRRMTAAFSDRLSPSARGKLTGDLRAVLPGWCERHAELSAVAVRAERRGKWEAARAELSELNARSVQLRETMAQLEAEARSELGR